MKRKNLKRIRTVSFLFAVAGVALIGAWELNYITRFSPYIYGAITFISLVVILVANQFLLKIEEEEEQEK